MQWPSRVVSRVWRHLRIAVYRRAPSLRRPASGGLHDLPELRGLSPRQRVEVMQEAMADNKDAFKDGPGCAVAFVMLGFIFCVGRPLSQAASRGLQRIGLEVAPATVMDVLVPVVFIAAGLLSWLVFSQRVIRPHLRRRLAHLCDHCGYDLTGNTSGTCPKCGTVREIRPPS